MPLILPSRNRQGKAAPPSLAATAPPAQPVLARIEAAVGLPWGSEKPLGNRPLPGGIQGGRHKVADCFNRAACGPPVQGASGPIHSGRAAADLPSRPRHLTLGLQLSPSPSSCEHAMADPDDDQLGHQTDGPVLLGPVVAQVLTKSEEGKQGQEAVEASAGVYNELLLQPARRQARLPLRWTAASEERDGFPLLEGTLPPSAPAGSANRICHLVTPEGPAVIQPRTGRRGAKHFLARPSRPRGIEGPRTLNRSSSNEPEGP
jgi:hypothetical protein